MSTEASTEYFTLHVGNSIFSENNSRMSLPIDGGYDVTNKRLALVQLNIPFSWRNITAAFGNNSFAYVLGATTFPVNIPDGNYSVSELNQFLQFTMKANGHYLVDTNAIEQYYVSFQINAVYYRTTFTMTTVPAVLPGGWTDPNPGAGSIITLSASNTPQLTFAGPSGTAFGEVLGQSPATIPAITTSTIQVNGDLVPNVAVISVVQIAVPSLINNSAANDSMVYFISPTRYAYGSYIFEDITSLDFYHVNGANFINSLDIIFLDQLQRPVSLLDTDCTLKFKFES